MYREQHGLEIESGLEDPIDDARARALQVPLPASRPDPSADPLGPSEPYRCARFEGFSLHANVAISADDREGLLRLARYGARHAFSQRQLRELPDGRLAYALKRPWGPSAARELILEPTELLHRLAALIPRPYLNLTRFHGVFTPNARRRNEVCPGGSPRRPVHRHLPPAEDEETTDPPPLALPAGPPPQGRIPWAELLRRTIAVDVLECPRCLTGTLAVLAFITDASVVLKILRHLDLPTELAAVAPARVDPQLELEGDLLDDADEPCFDLGAAEPRGPP